MTLAKTHIVAIAVAAILVVGGIGFFLLKDNGNKEQQNDGIGSTLALYGNANNDEDIDEKDIELIDEIISGDKKMAEYPLADANNDGAVDDKDKALVEKIINQQPCTVHATSLTPDGKKTSVAIDYPLKNVVPFGTNMLVSLINAGGVDKTVGVFRIGYENAENLLKAKVDSGAIKNYGASSRVVSDKVFNSFTAHDGELIAAGNGGMGALLLDHSASAFDERYDALEAANIPILRLAVADPYEEIGSTLLIGFLMGGSSKTVAMKYATESLKTINEIQDMVSSLTDSTKKTYISITMGKYICQNDSTYNQAGKYGGGLPYHLTNPTFANEYVGNGSTKMSSAEALSNYDDVDFIFSNRSVDIMNDPGQTILEDWDEYKEFFINLDCYKNLVYVNNLLPGAVKIAFVAAIVSSEQVSMSYAEETLAKFAGGFAKSLTGVTTDNSLIIGTYEDYKAAGGSS